MVIASSFSVRHICFYEWEPDHCAEDSRRRSYDVTSVSQMETSDDPPMDVAIPNERSLRDAAYQGSISTPAQIASRLAVKENENFMLCDIMSRHLN